MNDSLVATVVAFFTAVGVALISGLYNLRNTKKEGESSPYQHLMERVVRVEKQLNDLESENEQLVEENHKLRKALQDTTERVVSLELHLDSYRNYILLAAPWIDGHRDIARFPPPEPLDWWDLT